MKESMKKTVSAKRILSIILNLFMFVAAAAIVSLLFFDGERIGKKWVWLSVLPTAVYAVVYLVKVVALGPEKGGWADFYGFNRGGHWYLSLVIMLAGTALPGWILQTVHDRVSEITF